MLLITFSDNQECRDRIGVHACTVTSLVTHKPFVVFSLSCPAKERSDRVALVGTWHSARVDSPQASPDIVNLSFFFFLAEKFSIKLLRDIR